MPTRSSHPSHLRAPSWVTLAAGLLLSLTAHAGGGHDEAPASSAHGAALAEEPKVIAKDSLKRKIAAGKGAAPTPAPAESSTESASQAKGAPPSVSMSELRELIDQKIAEVRAKQAPAPALKVVAKSPKPRAPAAARPAASAAPDAAALAAAHRAGATALPGHDHWDYGGPAGPQSWGQLKADFKTCSTGQRQSPIDIRDGIKVQLEPIQFDYRPTPFRVIDNGHTVQVNLDPGNNIVVSGRRYELLQFHFHRPSEERINGRQYEMVAHLVHKDAEGRLAVVAVLLDQGKEHPMVQLVWNSLPLEKGMEQASPVMLDMNLMLPEQRQYYTYMGSLTTPPCTEGVLWMVMKQPATLSPYQASVFSRLYSNNARPLQSTAGRLIKEGQ